MAKEMQDDEFETICKSIEKLTDQNITQGDRIRDLEQKLAEGLSGDGVIEIKANVSAFGKTVVDSEVYKRFLEGNAAGGCRVTVKTAIINAAGSGQPLVQGQRRDGVVTAPTRRLSIRDLLVRRETTSNMIEFAKENVFTNNAGPTISGSPEQVENVTKPESGITFTLATEPVRTLAHWIPVSKQVLADSPMLQNYINTRLLYGLRLKEDTQLLLGTGINGQLQGLYTNRTAYTVPSPTVYTKKLDVLRDAIGQLQLADYEPSAIILNPADWKKIELAKVATNDDRYVVGDPKQGTQPMLWGLPVVPTNSMTANTFLVGDFAQAAELYDREDANVEIGLNADNMVKNMRTVLCEERLALAILRSGALVGGAFLS